MMLTRFWDPGGIATEAVSHYEVNDDGTEVEDPGGIEKVAVSPP